MITDYMDGRREELLNLTDEMLAEELRKKAEHISTIDRLLVARQEPIPDEPNRHERRKRAALERRST